jgi:hypothetical protein
LRRALERAKAMALSHVILDGKIMLADRCREKTISVKGEVHRPVLPRQGAPQRLAAHNAEPQCRQRVIGVATNMEQGAQARRHGLDA